MSDTGHMCAECAPGARFGYMWGMRWATWMISLVLGGAGIGCTMGNPAFDPAQDDVGDGAHSDDGTASPGESDSTHNGTDTGDDAATTGGEGGDAANDAGLDGDLPDEAPPPVAPDPCDDAEPDLVACYDFDEITAGNAADGSGNHNDVMIEGASLTPGIDGKALLLDEHSRAAAADSSSLKFEGAVSVELWVRVDAADGEAGLVHKQSQFGLVRLADGTLECKRAGAWVKGGLLPLGTWTEVACIFDGSAISIEVDRVEVARKEVPDPPGAFNDKPVMIGSKSPDFAAPLTGAIDAVRIWKGAR